MDRTIVFTLITSAFDSARVSQTDLSAEGVVEMIESLYNEETVNALRIWLENCTMGDIFTGLDTIVVATDTITEFKG